MSRPSSSSNLRAIVYINLAMVSLAASDAASKWLVDRYGPFQILFVRSALVIPLAVVAIAACFGVAALRSHRPMVHALRGLLWVLAAGAFMSALASLPLAEATALWFVAPLFVVLLGALFFGERITAASVAALVVGMVGMLLIVRPGTAAFDPAALLAIAGALVYAFSMLTARSIDARDNIWTVMVWTLAFGGLFTSFTLLQAWPAPSPGDYPAFAIVAVGGALGVTLLTQAFRLGPTAVIAPFEYTILLWASVIGWVAFGTVPSVWTTAGSGLIVAGSLVLLWHERYRDRRASRIQD